MPLPATGLPAAPFAGSVFEEADSVIVAVDSVSGSSLAVADSVVADTMALAAADAMPQRPSRIRREKVDLDNQVVFSCADSMVMIGRKMTYMYGDGKVDYGDLKLQAADIALDLDRSEVEATGVVDSLGEM